MAVRIRDTSRLRWTRFLTVQEVEFWDLPEYPKIGPNDDDIRYIVTRSDRIDLISNRFYQSPDLWWVIAARNGLRLLPSDLYEGQELRIPSPRRVTNEILRNPSRGRDGR